ncbi:MAG: iron-containing alcohol dehydrogenase [Clostridia bacterium]|jgi:alcohol dehydrogenase class IV|nr:iron-containing alcohol dehydrogenase [Clostridia bacterium]MDH7573002.1 iron-containing alcohol dehydrogenase [Clostridia bacterium]
MKDALGTAAAQEGGEEMDGLRKAFLRGHPILTGEKYKGFGIKQTVYQGSGCINKIPEILAAEGWKRVLLVVDPGVLNAGGAKKCMDLLTAAGVEYQIFSKIEPNPLEVDIEKYGIPMYKEMKADVMIALGGGSTLDSAKGIAMVGDSNMTVREASDKCFEIGPFTPPPWKTYPIIAVPTTAGTGSEVIRNAVITEPNGHKMVPMHDCILPAYAICDPDLLATLPPHVAAATAMDALVQAVEAYVSLAANDFSEMMSLRAVEHIGPHIVPYYHNRAIPEHADHMSKGCMYAGFAWNNSFIAQIHGSNHPVTEILGISHGEACAILFPAFVEFNGQVCKEKFRKVYNLMYPDHPVAKEEFEPEMLVKKLIQLNRDLNILNGKTLADYGCTEEIVDRIVSEFNDRLYCLPRTTTKAQLKQMYMDVMNGKYS